MRFDIHIHLGPEVSSLIRDDLNRKLNHLTERLTHMATDAQVAKLSADVNTLLDAVEAFKTAVLDAIAKAQAQTNDPAVDALDAKVADEVAKLSAAMPAAPPA